MDFASLMKSQIATAAPSKTSSPDTSGTTTKRYLKRSEIEAARQASYRREQAEAEQERLKRVELKRKREDEDAEREAAREAKRERLAVERRAEQAEAEWREENKRRVRIGLPELPARTSEDEAAEAGKEGNEDVPEEELLERLKELDEPRFLFAESHPQRLRRYRALTAPEPSTPSLTTGPIPTTIELLEEQDMKIPAHVPSSAAEQTHLRRQLASYFTLILTAWSHALAARPAATKASLAGRQAHQNYTATISNLTPLFRKLESDTLTPPILAAVVEITHLAQLRRYVQANDAYLRLSIGKAAWPIGVTMVGIHERSAREKLGGEGGRAHILSDEVTRKILQGVKRSLSFAQVRWPPEDVGELMG
ncbi:hypothetical protein B0A50_04802 [Salinomyces thailandicus]|uniref:Pre-mRNA-splicing factor 18 n=1 Tax=Salinomyces thailandicus TaxID=706561 RepID=A0A4U0TWL6_9PEZI|nr:hypothetical protein B0A50_04802 [Salinomyces thailandica]